MKSWVSLPVGVVTLAERHGGMQVDRALFELMVTRRSPATLAPFTAMHDGHSVDGAHMLGTSGTVTTIAGIHLNLPRYDRRRVDGCWLHDGEVTRVIDRLLGMTLRGARRQRLHRLRARRDLVLAGCAILEAIRRAFPCAAAPGRRSRPARGHSRQDDA